MLCVGVVVFTVYIFMSSYEILTNTPLPFTNSVESFRSQNTINNILGTHKIYDNYDSANFMNRGETIDQLRIAKTNTLLGLVPYKLNPTYGYIFRKNTAHFIFFGEDKGPESALVYMPSNWRGLVNPGNLEVGDNVFFVKNDGKSVTFRIREKKVTNLDANYVPTKTQNFNLVLIMDNLPSNTLYIFNAEYLSSEN